MKTREVFYAALFSIIEHYLSFAAACVVVMQIGNVFTHLMDCLMYKDVYDKRVYEHLALACIASKIRLGILMEDNDTKQKDNEKKDNVSTEQSTKKEQDDTVSTTESSNTTDTPTTVEMNSELATAKEV
jgi:hypothetical protein